MIIDSVRSVEGTMNSDKTKGCFELFGYDFMIDENCRTWLLELNSNPFIGYSCSHLEKLVPRMMSDLFKVFVFPYTTNP